MPKYKAKAWNVAIGCTKYSAGCLNCYAKFMAENFQKMGVKDYADGFQFKLMPHRLDLPLKTKTPTSFFLCSMTDLFHEEMPDEYLDRVFEVIKATPQHWYDVLTKRAERMEKYFRNKKLPKNIAIGVTVENREALFRIDLLKKIPAKVRFLALQPLLEDLGELDLTGIHSVVVSGESSLKARRMREEWAVKILEQCQTQGVKFSFLFWGNWGADGKWRTKKANGRKLLGKTWPMYTEAEPEDKQLKLF